MASKSSNIWEVQDIDIFKLYCCPEKSCQQKFDSKDVFVQHAIETHREAKNSEVFRKFAIHQPKKFYNKGRICAALECNSRQGHCDLQFFHVKRASEEQTMAWAKAINRKNDDGGLWMPNSSDLICSKHFVTGKPSKDRRETDFRPTLFGTNSLKDLSDSVRSRNERVSTLLSISK